jgi:hypothetical protein
LNWLRRNYLLALSIAIPFLLGGYFWGKTVEEDYRIRPAIDQSEVKWSLIEAYGGGAILFGSLGALTFYLARAVVKNG